MRPRRLILALGLPLALGLMTTVIVAWGLACAPICTNGLASTQVIRPKRSPVGYDLFGAPNEVKVAVFSRPGRVVVYSHCFGPEWPLMSGLSRSTMDPSDLPPDQLVPYPIRKISIPWLFDRTWPVAESMERRIVPASGWPLLALACEERPDEPPSERTLFAIRLPGTRSVGNSRFSFNPASRLLPLRPLWPGLALDTLLFAAFWRGLLLLPGMIRRRSPWACPSCRYDRRGLAPDAPCPECGRPT